MSRYIDADDVFSVLQKRLHESAYNNINIEVKADELFEEIAKNRIQIWVNDMPTADVVPYRIENGEVTIDLSSIREKIHGCKLKIYYGREGDTNE